MSSILFSSSIVCDNNNNNIKKYNINVEKHRNLNIVQLFQYHTKTFINMGKRDRGSDASRKDKKKKSKKHSIVKKESRVKEEEQDDGSANSQKLNTKSLKLIKQQLSTKEASNALVDGEKPVFFRKRAKLSISLLPWSLRDCKQSVENSIRKMMLKYSNGLGGILMAYDDVQLQDDKSNDGSGGKGWVLNELPHIHYDVLCNVLVFFPSIGCEVSKMRPNTFFDICDEYHDSKTLTNTKLNLNISHLYNPKVERGCKRMFSFPCGDLGFWLHQCYGVGENNPGGWLPI